MSKKNPSNRVCVALITDGDDNILFGKRKDTGKYTNIGGHAEIGECAYDAMCREMKEEAGLDALDVKIAKVAKVGDKLIYIFKVKIDPNQKIDVSKDPDKEFEDGSLQFLDPNTILDNLHVPVDKNLVLQAYLEE